MRLASLKPARGEGLGIIGGLFLCFLLHVFAFIAVGKPPLSASIVRVYEDGARR